MTKFGKNISCLSFQKLGVEPVNGSGITFQFKFKTFQEVKLYQYKGLRTARTLRQNIFSYLPITLTEHCIDKYTILVVLA